MTAPQQPGYLPGTSVPYGMTPGVRQVLPGINDQAPPAPYGMLPGQRHVLPDQVNLDAAPVKPDDVTLDEQPAEGPGVLASTHKVRSFRVTNEKGEVVADLPDNPAAGGGANDYYKAQVQKIGDSLVSQAVNPADKEAAARATQFGMSLVGLMPIKDIQTAIVHRYDTDERNSISRETQAAKTARAHGGPGVPPGGVTKAQKTEELIDKDASATMEEVIKDKESQAKLSALNSYEQTIDQLEAQMSKPDAMSQRAAVAEYMKTLTGKQSTDMERRQILGANGALDRIANELNMWNPGDASMTKAFQQSFRKNVAVMRANVEAQKKKLAQETSDALSHHPFLAKHGNPAAMGNYGRGRISGDYGDKPAAGGVDPDLLK